MVSNKHKDIIINAIRVLRSRRVRPSARKIAWLVRREHFMSEAATDAALDQLVESEEVLRVEYKGATSYRVAASWSRTAGVKRRPIRTKVNVMNSEATCRALTTAVANCGPLGGTKEHIALQLQQMGLERLNDRLDVYLHREIRAGTLSRVETTQRSNTVVTYVLPHPSECSGTVATTASSTTTTIINSSNATSGSISSVGQYVPKQEQDSSSPPASPLAQQQLQQQQQQQQAPAAPQHPKQEPPPPPQQQQQQQNALGSTLQLSSNPASTIATTFTPNLLDEDDDEDDDDDDDDVEEDLESPTKEGEYAGVGGLRDDAAVAGARRGSRDNRGRRRKGGGGGVGGGGGGSSSSSSSSVGRRKTPLPAPQPRLHDTPDLHQAARGRSRRNKRARKVFDPSEGQEAAPAARKRLGSRCDVCLHNVNQHNLVEELLVCHRCSARAHPSCLGYSEELAVRSRLSPWTCMDCKHCAVCNMDHVIGTLIFCDECDHAYHLTCHQPPLNEQPQGSWVCYNCAPSAVHNGYDSLPGLPTPRDSPVPDDESRGSSGSWDNSYDPDIPNVSHWTVEQIMQHFNSKGYQDFSHVFNEQDIDGTALLMLTRNDILTGLNLKLGPALKIYKQVRILQMRLHNPPLL
ncbi:uncharacterized protein LOC143027693 [Oratosquilla oratoria]|uniref:uncharacterized protein LOC143027693 n=1 Tax=Oratosquilla oratoria TaxID=337810 RepID=UPI003F76DDD8